MQALEIVGGLAFFFTFIISMAVSNGAIASMRYETDDARAGSLSDRRGLLKTIREYRLKNPEGKRHIRMFQALFVAFAAMAGGILYVFVLSKFA